MENKKALLRKLNNKGTTLIELLVSMAISSIVIGMIIMMISAGSRSYNIAQDEVNIQTQSQTTANQIEDILIEANWMERKTDIKKAGTSDIASDVTAYIIYSSEGNSAIIFDRTQQLLFYMEGVSVSQINNMATDSYTKAINLMATNITEFTLEADSSTLKESQKTELHIMLKNKTSELTVDKTIAFRNHATPTPTPTP